MGQRWCSGVVVMIGLLAMSAPMAEAARVPDRQVNGIEWFYVFGPEGNRAYGAAEKYAKQVFYVEVPKDVKGSVTIRVLDADLQGRHDEVDGALNTSTRFTVFGGSNLLTSRTITASEPDGTTLELGPFSLDQGDGQGHQVIFRIEAEGLEGNDNNLFAFEITPSQAKLFTFTPSIRLMSREGGRMRFFAQIPSGVTGIRVWNYDLDPMGGNSVLLTPPAPMGSVKGIQKAFWIENSKSAAWARTDVTVPQEWTGGGQWIYQITKKTQSAANMSMRIEDQNSKPLRIYFTQDEPIQVAQAAVKACNAFEFDASKSFDRDNTKLTYHWDLGDGTTSDQIRTQHTYEQAGDYKVLLTVTDASTGECRSSQTEQQIRANTLPLAVLDAPVTGCIGSAVRLSAAKSSDTSGERLTYAWDLGDGTMAEGAEVTHTYARGGTYPITLLVDDGQGTACSLTVAKGEVLINTPPVANAGPNSVCCLNAVTAFDASQSTDADGDQLTYRWDFGDGATAEGVKGTHVYKNTGTYQVRVTASDNSDSACGVSSDGFTAKVEERPVAVMEISSEGKDISPTAGELAADARRNR